MSSSRPHGVAVLLPKRSVWSAMRAFEKLGVQRLQLMVAVNNDASHRVAEKNGYQREGLLRSAYRCEEFARTW